MSFSFYLYLFFFLTMVYFFSGHIFLLVLINYLRPNKISWEKGTMENLLLPKITVIIPFFNEETIVSEKLNNILKQDYPKDKLKIIFVDGGSTDKSFKILRDSSLALDQNISILSSPLSGKINQVNHALNLVPRENFVVITDCDAILLSPYSLKYAVNCFIKNPEVGLVGGSTMPRPENAMLEETAYWDKQNRMRYLEMKCFSASIVVAPFYMFKRNLLSNFPQDCVADDVYISLLTHLKKLRILYLPYLKVEEVRTPSGLFELIKHKLRKSNAYMTELFRFLYKLPYMGKRLKLIFLGRLLQFFYMPWGVIGFILMIFRMIYSGEYLFLIVSLSSLFFLMVLASLCMIPATGEIRGGVKFKSIIATVNIFAIMILVLIVDFIIYPFWKQSSSYEKVSS